jgi:hypothetical protein
MSAFDCLHGGVGLSLTRGYLTSNQRLVWSLKSEGFTEADIGRKLDIKRQTVHKALNVANQKILQALEETAKINKIEIKTVSPTRGYLVGYSPHFETEAFVTYSPKNGIQIWYKHEGNCKKCRRAKVCRETILEEARERKLDFEGDVSETSPSKLADILFSMITGEETGEEAQAS